MFIFSSLNLRLLVTLIVVGQMVFALASSAYTAPRYEGRIYATIGVELRGGSDLHKLNEAAHFFGQTIIGWTKFPHFADHLKEKAGLPEDLGFNAHMQERQNIVFTLTSSEPVTPTHLFETKNYLQGKLASYNESSSTGFALSNLDYEELETTRSYQSGASITFFITLLFWLAWLYLKN